MAIRYTITAESGGERILKIDQYVAKLLATVECPSCFLTHGVVRHTWALLKTHVCYRITQCSRPTQRLDDIAFIRRRSYNAISDRSNTLSQRFNDYSLIFVPTLNDNFERSYSQRTILTFWPPVTWPWVKVKVTPNLTSLSLDYVQQFHKISQRSDQ